MAILEKKVLSVGQYLLNSKLSIPPYQRPYKWGSKNALQLIEDISRFKGKPYRIGTIVVCKQNESWEIVDGQQRTVTFLLILRAIQDHCYGEIEAADLKEMLETLSRSQFRPKFVSDVSKQNLQTNYREIERRVVDMNEGFIRFFLTQCQVTYFVIDNISEAFQFFDSQNSRGKDLEPHDLLKAYHLRELQKKEHSAKEEEVTKLVDRWEEMKTWQLTNLFTDFLYRVREWSSGRSARYFTKEKAYLFKGVNLNDEYDYPYLKAFRIIADHFQKNTDRGVGYPFQLDQVVINGNYFFEMVNHYETFFSQGVSLLEPLDDASNLILETLRTYDGKDRTGDRYIRMMFNCALLFYLDKFGKKDIERAILKIFIWAYTPRLTYQNLQLASVDNYVTQENNLFRRIHQAVHTDRITGIELPLITKPFDSPKTRQIKELFIKFKYYGTTV
ncbi:DUF262 domain-containing protein [Mucilaginibacter sp. 14171R-50]|uniref:DUF262 domain-containing protein n=1 Tax=Mucilaginibacter sp. 14171R-50 TaxID=2703789 RepID=UPI00138B4FE9|nr:DUF262 domain-containing protein [Mucilaginibacter sp. 14171R-50]QHS56806.1 DUF262 domain-containing protein [Mucilaginibacter sp. 14171R-50]